MIRQCSDCRAIDRDGRWVFELPEPGASITHTYCRSCREAAEAILDAELLAAVAEEEGACST